MSAQQASRSALAQEIRELLEDGFDIPSVIRMLQEAEKALIDYEDMEDKLIAAERSLAKLADESIFLNCLRNAGVDNWEWYDVACEDYRNIMGEED